jgi:hypothetical protein
MGRARKCRMPWCGRLFVHCPRFRLAASGVSFAHSGWPLEWVQPAVYCKQVKLTVDSSSLQLDMVWFAGEWVASNAHQLREQPDGRIAWRVHAPYSANKQVNLTNLSRTHSVHSASFGNRSQCTRCIGTHTSRTCGTAPHRTAPHRTASHRLAARAACCSKATQLFAECAD